MQAAQGGGAVCANVPSYWAAFLRLLQRPPGFFAPLSEAHAAALASQEPGLASAGGVAVQRGDLRAGDVQKQLEGAVRQLVGQEVDPEEPLMAAGLDSLAAMELQNMISASMGVELPSTLVFDYPSVRAMSGFIEAQMGVASAEAPAAAAVLRGPSAPAQGGARSAHLAGLAARMPEGRALGGAGGDSRCSVDAVCPVPFERWDVDVDLSLIHI